MKMPVLTIATAMLISGSVSALPLYNIGTGDFGDTNDYFKQLSLTGGSDFDFGASGFELEGVTDQDTKYYFGMTNPEVNVPGGKGYDINKGVFSGLSVTVENDTGFDVDFGIYVYTDEYVLCGPSEQSCVAKMEMGAWQDSLIPTTVADGVISTLTFDFSDFVINPDVPSTYFPAPMADVRFSGIFNYGIYAVVSNRVSARPPTVGVPEPSVLLMLGAGLLAMGYVGRRKKV